MLKHFFCALGVLGMLLLPTRFAHWAEEVPQRVAVAATAEPLKILRGTIGRNETLARALDGTLKRTDVYHLVESARPVYDLARLSVGHPFGLAIAPDGLLRTFTYGIDELRTLRVTRQGDALEAEVLTRTYETKVTTVSGEITSSLFGAVTDAGEDDQLALDLADIFAWDVDFNTELQRGDSFRVAVPKLSVDGRFIKYGPIVSAEFVRGERVLRAVRFEREAGSAGYYSPDGKPLRKAFLRSPLRFTRVSSGFTMRRLHPVLHTVRAHLGIDFAAPTGTPVSASADGVVSSAGWAGGYGKSVRIRHNNGFETLYGHLSRIDVRAGQRVSQGTRIGAVGQTGLATGPHLDYRMAQNGVFVNPFRAQTPPAEPIDDAERPAFETARREALVLLGVDAPASRPTAAATLLSAPVLQSLPQRP
jgi:murein DD-endopeptidase MepM/ murein hydrolase activator NlpD